MITDEKTRTLYEYLHTFYRYEPSDKTRPFVNLKGKRIGSLASPKNRSNLTYVRTSINKVAYKMAQLVWLYHTGELLSGSFVIHVSDDSMDNTIENLTSCYVYDEMSPQVVKDIFEYDSSDPKQPLIFKHDINCYNRKGERPGYYNNTSGYMFVNLNGKRFPLHHLVYCWHKGYLPNYPKDEIDHIDHQRANNVIENLRLVTHKENTKNLSMNRNNTSGTSGVYFNKARQRWYAFGSVNNNRVNIGSSKDKQEAIEMRQQWLLYQKYHLNHGM